MTRCLGKKSLTLLARHMVTVSTHRSEYAFLHQRNAPCFHTQSMCASLHQTHAHCVQTQVRLCFLASNTCSLFHTQAQCASLHQTHAHCCHASQHPVVVTFAFSFQIRIPEAIYRQFCPLICPCLDSSPEDCEIISRHCRQEKP